MRFSYPWALASLTGIFLVLLTFGYSYFSRTMDFGFWIFVPFLPLLFLYAVELFGQLVFHGARAVWIADGRLIFLPYGFPRSFKTFTYSIPLETIDRFSLESIDTGGFVTWLKGIRVHEKSGRYAQIPTYLMAEPRDTILARLNEALAANR